MYAGTTIRHGSGRLVGVHQKIDRAARRHLKKHISASVSFPKIKDILYFEGNNGPDGLKRKSPPTEQAWYFIDPQQPDDRALISIINDRIINLSIALRNHDVVRSSFESAWLAHAIVDGLTPAHHYPLDDMIEELWGKNHYDRATIWEKNVIKGDGIRDTISKNWQYWGIGGVFTTHGMFEMGVASAIATENFKDIVFKPKIFNRIKKLDFEVVFTESLNRVNSLQMYEELGQKGWTQKLARQTKKVLVPEIIQMVTLAWYKAIILSEVK